MKNFSAKLVLFVNYFVFAVLLNTVGAVILQVQRTFNATKADAALLEGFKDLPIAIGSFLLAAYIPKFGYKKTMLVGLGLVTAICFIMPSATAFWYFKLLFFVVGISFALIKVSVFSTIGLLTDSQKEHSSLMSMIEGVFMIGILCGNVLFSYFVNDNNAQSREWLNLYWALGALAGAAFLLLLFIKIDQSKIQEQTASNSIQDDFMDMLKIAAKPLVLLFIASVALYVLIEQSFQTWMPTFYKDVLQVPASMSIQAGAVLAGAFAVGRFGAGVLLQKIHWLRFVLICLICSAISVVFVLYFVGNGTASANTNWFNAPLVAYLFPLMGVFLAPIYPAINSLILNTLPKHQHAAMTGLIVVFSALGGTLGSIITGNVFQHFDGKTAFLLSLIPMALLGISLVFFNRKIEKVTQ
jgi:fucose permease